VKRSFLRAPGALIGRNFDPALEVD